MLKNYIGLACTGHENAIAIVDAAGDVVFAEATERFLQNKRGINTPADDVLRMPRLLAQWCDPQAELVVAKTWSRSAAEAMKADASLMLGATAGANPATDRDWLTRVMFHVGLWDKLIGPNCQLAGTGIARHCNTAFRRMSVREYNHHLTHAAYACFTSPFDEAVCMVVDGYGEGVSHSFYRYAGGEIVPLQYERSAANRYGSLASLGLFYGYTVCSLFGLEITNGEEWKVMGLAPYGRLNTEFLELLQRHIRVDGLDFVMDEQAGRSYTAMRRFARGPQQSLDDLCDIAFTAQHHFNELLFRMLGRLAEICPSQNLVFSGGCALNSSFNGLVSLRSGFKNLYVPPAPSDDGNAVGAALLAYRQDHPHHPQTRPQPQRSARAIHSPFLGSRIDEKELGQFAANASMLGHVDVAPGEISEYVAEALAQGCVVGWVQGRAEFGPRSLGNRSILADPRDASMKDRINAIVKFREGFRPFAPSILDEYGDEYFEDYSFTPYMEKTLKIRPHLRERIPAVCHVDGTGRLQSVTAGLNPRFHALIEAFRRRTGVPVVLNTSLNVMGKPIVHSAADAVGIYLSSRIDMLVIDDWVFRKTPTPGPRRAGEARARRNTPETAVPGAADTLGV